MVRVFHFCADYAEGGHTHVYTGVITTDIDPFSFRFFNSMRDKIAASIDPPRPSEEVAVRSLSLLAEK